MMQHDND